MMRWRKRGLLIAGLLGFSLGAGVDAVLDWNEAMIDAIRMESTAPPLATRNLAMADAAIQRADEDGNNATTANPDWTPYLNTPAFPEYTSGHSTFSKAAAVVLAHFFGSDHIPFQIGSDSLPGIYRGYASFTEAANECGLSRIYGGIHYRFSNQDGKACGEAVARYVTSHFLLPLDRLPQLVSTGLRDGQFQFMLHGLPGREYAIEFTTGFDRWQPVLTNTAGFSGALPFSIDPSISPAGFFRSVSR